MTEYNIIHSVKIDKEKCIGCVTCMQACPTKAIRVHEKKAHIMFERCVDCGECLRVCIHNAVIPITTSTADLNRFKYKVALPSPVLYSQFGHHAMPHEILAILEEIGFDYVYDEALICEMVSQATEKYLDEHRSPRPIISSSCPVVVRIIQRLFPSLCNLVIPFEPPREIAAKNLRQEISKKRGIRKEDIGIFHITPCSAKMVSINYPLTLKKSHLEGAIAIKDIYNKVMMRIKKSKKPSLLEKPATTSGIGIGWAIAGGEIRSLKYLHSVSVSGIYDTIKILEDIEAGKLKDIEYLECITCPDGCVGGPLTVENRFISKSNILRLIKIYGRKKKVNGYSVKSLYKKKFFSFENSIKPNPFPPLNRKRNQALKKLKLKEETIKKLPGTNCGVCGAPDCQTLADDIARQKAKIEDCIFFK